MFDRCKSLRYNTEKIREKDEKILKENKNLIIRSSSAEFLIFEQQKKEKGIEVRFEEGDLWLTQGIRRTI